MLNCLCPKHKIRASLVAQQAKLLPANISILNGCWFVFQLLHFQLNSLLMAQAKVAENSKSACTHVILVGDPDETSSAQDQPVLTIAAIWRVKSMNKIFLCVSSFCYFFSNKSTNLKNIYTKIRKRDSSVHCYRYYLLKAWCFEIPQVKTEFPDF